MGECRRIWENMEVSSHGGIPKLARFLCFISKSRLDVDDDWGRTPIPFVTGGEVRSQAELRIVFKMRLSSSSWGYTPSYHHPYFERWDFPVHKNHPSSYGGYPRWRAGHPLIYSIQKRAKFWCNSSEIHREKVGDVMGQFHQHENIYIFTHVYN